MKNFEMSAYGVEEMKSQELKDVSGGFWWLIVLALAVGYALYDIIKNKRSKRFDGSDF